MMPEPLVRICSYSAASAGEFARKGWTRTSGHRQGRSGVPRVALGPDVGDRIDPFPALLAQPFELHDGTWSFWLDRLRQEVDDLLRDRSPLSLGTCAQTLIESIRKVLEVERRHC